LDRVPSSTSFSRIARHAGTLGGEPVIKGTRIPVSVIILYSRLNDSDVTEIQRAYPQLEDADIREALAFYAANPAEIDRAIEKYRDPAVEG
jgi:uncharacterized protein (DUF433 family)